MSKIRVILELGNTDRIGFQRRLGMDDNFDLVDSIFWEMDYGDTASGGEPSSHNGIAIRVEEIDEKNVDTK